MNMHDELQRIKRLDFVLLLLLDFVHFLREHGTGIGRQQTVHMEGDKLRDKIVV